MADMMMQPPLDAPIPGQSLTHELGARPWQQPAQYTTVEDALDYYIPRLESEEVTNQLLDVLEMGIPVTTVANTMQLGSVMEGKHSVDVGMLILPVLVELIMLIADSAKIEYTSGLEKDKKMRGSLVDLAVSKFKEDKDKTKDSDIVEEKDDGKLVADSMKQAAEERVGGLMSRGA
jgi:hypothetical protein|tara:strand:+ start:1069 stop:1596 length:528 start_codon:yes stop_codon:yes gene_type:complete